MHATVNFMIIETLFVSHFMSNAWQSAWPIAQHIIFGDRMNMPINEINYYPFRLLKVGFCHCVPQRYSFKIGSSK